jgi:hypothetical protein
MAPSSSPPLPSTQHKAAPTEKEKNKKKPLKKNKNESCFSFGWCDFPVRSLKNYEILGKALASS